MPVPPRSKQDDALSWLHSQTSAMESAVAQLVDQNSFTANRDGGNRVGAMLRDLLQPSGLACEVVSSTRCADHLVFSTPAAGSPVALVGHLDTVFPPGTFEGYRREGEVAMGPGVLDMKGGLVVMAFAALALAHAGLLASLPLRLIVVSDEEVGSPEGQPVLHKYAERASCGLVFEAGRVGDAIVTQRKGTGSVAVVAQGKAAHAGNLHHEGINAIWALARFIDKAQALTDYAKGNTVNVGTIEGGQGRNTVPDAARAELDIRFFTRHEGALLVVRRHAWAEGPTPTRCPAWGSRASTDWDREGRAFIRATSASSFPRWRPRSRRSCASWRPASPENAVSTDRTRGAAGDGAGKMLEPSIVHGYIDLHCHWIAAIDDGAPSQDEGLAMLRALGQAGFDFVMATPHMRPAMFDNTKAGLTQAFDAMATTIAESGLPRVGLSSEHFFDDVVYRRLMSGEGLPYPGGKAVLVEFPTEAFPARVADCFFELRLKRLRPVLAHPERYRPVWKDKKVLDPLIDGGAVLLLDVAALVGKYGRASERAALELLEDGYYEAACSDAHRAKDVDEVVKGIARLHKLVGREEAEYLLRDGPEAILAGNLDT